MKTLVVIRHAHSKAASTQESDFVRPLSHSGEREVSIMARAISAKKIVPDLIISSPALRAFQTANLFCDINGYQKEKVQFIEKLYHADASTLLAVISSLKNDAQSVFLVGHNPGVTELINLLDMNVRLDHMPTCGVFTLTVETKSWGVFFESSKRFLFFDYPQKN